MNTTNMAETLVLTSNRSSCSSTHTITEKSASPPSLNYSLGPRKLAVAICWLLVFLDSVVLAIVSYYPLTYATDLEPWKGILRRSENTGSQVLTSSIVMTIVTCIVGMISLIQFFYRTYLLVRHESTSRPIGSPRYALDSFHWIYIVGIIIVVVELVLGTIPDQPIMGLCSMPLASILFLAAGCDLFATMGYICGWRLPVRLSSLDKAEKFRPGVYTVVEDIIAVDGGGGVDFRIALDLRYQTSLEFRSLLVKLSFFWSIPAIVIALLTTAIVWTTSEPVAFGIGWTMPFAWVTIWAMITVPYCRYLLKKEAIAWQARSPYP